MAGIARGGTAGIAGAAVSAVVNFALVIVITRFWATEDAGALFATTSLFLLAVALVELGVDQGFVRYIAWFRARREHARVPAVLLAGFVPVGLASLVAAAVAIALAGPAARLVGSHDPDMVADMLRVLALGVPVAVFYDLLLAATRGYGTMRSTVVYERLLRPVVQLASVCAAAAAGVGPIGLTVAWVAPYAAALAGAVFAFRQVHHRHARGAAAGHDRPADAVSDLTRADDTPGEADLPVVDADAIGRPPARPRHRRRSSAPLRAVAADFWRFTAARGLARVFQVGLQRLDIVLVAALRGPKDAAIYTAATRFLAVGQTAMQSAQQVLQPRLAALLAVHDTAATSAVFRTSTAWFVAMSWPVYLISAVFAPVLLSAFGSSYQEASSALVVLCLAMLVATAAGPVDVVLVMAGKSAAQLVNTAAALALDIVLCLILVPRYGALGAALAWTAAILMRNALSVVQVRSNLGMDARSPALAKVVGAALVTAGLLPWLVSLILPGLTGLVVGLLVATSAFGAVLWRLRTAIGLDAFATLVRRRPGSSVPAGSRS